MKQNEADYAASMRAVIGTMAKALRERAEADGAGRAAKMRYLANPEFRPSRQTPACCCP